MMQTANLWKSDYLAYFGGLDRPWHGTVLTQRKVCARLVIVIQIGSEGAVSLMRTGLQSTRSRDAQAAS